MNGVGLFRYVSDADNTKYNGEAYDANINWNDPIIEYDENGIVIYDPSDPLSKQDYLNKTSDPGLENVEINGTSSGNAKQSTMIDRATGEYVDPTATKEDTNDNNK